ncbi:MAG: hypothetical protein QM727_09060 [Niabella sp.]
MNKQITFVVSDVNQISQKIVDYFLQFNFKLMEADGNCLKFRKRSTLFDGWKTNPLNWGAQISVSVDGDRILADFFVDTDAQMNTREEEKVWLIFMENFENYLKNGEYPRSSLDTIIFDNRKSRLSYISWLILGALTGALLSLTYNKLTGNNATFSMVLVPFLAGAFLSWRIGYVKSKSAL